MQYIVTLTPARIYSVTYITPGQDMWMCGICGLNLHKKAHLVEHRKYHEKVAPAEKQFGGKPCTSVSVVLLFPFNK